MVVRELPSLRRWLDFQRDVRVAKCLHADTAFLHYAGANALKRFSIMRPVDAMLELAIGVAGKATNGNRAAIIFFILSSNPNSAHWEYHSSEIYQACYAPC